MDDKWKTLEDATGLSVARDVSLKRFTSIGIGGLAGGAVTVEREKDIEKVFAAAAKLRIPVKVLGGGTNVVFSDTGFSGLLVRLGDSFKKIEIRFPRVIAGAAVHLSALITRTMESGLSGVEKLAGIPGTLGGAIRQNSGAWETSISDTVRTVTFWDIQDRRMRTLPKDDLAFRYRTSLFAERPAVICAVEFELQPAPRDVVLAEVNTRMRQRATSQPPGRSAGCIFKNPPDQPAGRLIDQAGLKGRRVGGLLISDIHGNFFINDGRATFADFERLVADVQTQVRERCGVKLELEVEIIRENGNQTKDV